MIGQAYQSARALLLAMERARAGSTLRAVLAILRNILKCIANCHRIAATSIKNQAPRFRRLTVGGKSRHKSAGTVTLTKARQNHCASISNRSAQLAAVTLPESAQLAALKGRNQAAKLFSVRCQTFSARRYLARDAKGRALDAI